MNNKKPRDPLYPRGFEETQELKMKFQRVSKTKRKRR